MPEESVEGDAATEQDKDDKQQEEEKTTTEKIDSILNGRKRKSTSLDKKRTFRAREGGAQTVDEDLLDKVTQSLM